MFIEGKRMKVIGNNKEGIWFLDEEELYEIFIYFIDLPKYAAIHPVLVM